MKLSKLLSSHEDKAMYATSDELVNNDCFIGIELELEKVSALFGNPVANSFDPYFWTLIEDGSLRDGVEFKFARPLKGATIIKALDVFDSAMNEARKLGINPVLSNRTSMHAHVDMRDLSTDEINQFILVYMLLESILFNYVGYYRVKNNYCRPLIGSDFSKTINKLMLEENLDFRYMLFINDNTDKYSALNSNSLTTFGTLEFRQHPGSFTKSEIVEWLNIILSIKSFIQSGATIYNIIDKDYEDVMNDIFGYELFQVLNKSGSRMLFESNRSAVNEVINLPILSDQTKSILKKNSKVSAENSLILKYANKKEKEEGLCAAL